MGEGPSHVGVCCPVGGVDEKYLHGRCCSDVWGIGVGVIHGR